MASLKAGRSSGLRLVTRLPSTTTSSSTQSAPALRRSVCRLGHEVTGARDDVGLGQRPRGVTDRRHRPVRLDEALTKATASLVHPQRVGVGHAAGQHEPVVRRGVGVRRRRRRRGTCRPCRGG